MQSVLSGRSYVHTSGKAGIIAPTSGTELEALNCLQLQHIA